MRIRLVCAECDPRPSVSPWFVETIREDGLYTGKCPQGHDLLLATQTLRHEMLFEIALNAIADGYYREAVSSFAASVERFYEFAIRVFCSSRAIEQSAFEEAWRKVASQSERQLGAYVFLHLLEFGAPPPLLSNRMTELRNDVVHRGSLPERTGALTFGGAVYEVIQQGVRRLRETHLEHVNKVLGEHMAHIFEPVGQRYPRAVLVTTTALNIIEDISAGYRTFDQLLRDHAASAGSVGE
jgi:hypothetical protein